MINHIAPSPDHSRLCRTVIVRRACFDQPLVELEFLTKLMSRSGAGGDAAREPASVSRVLKWCAKTVVVLTSAAAAAFLVGFVSFVCSIEFAERAPPSRADAIVALTGDPQRIREAADLLAKGYGARLLITGIDNRDEIARLSSRQPRLAECCIDVERGSRSTYGNAIEARRWVGENGFRSIVVVTSNFHLPRTLLEFDYALPEVQKIFYPVVTGRVDLREFWRKPTALRALGREYLKLLAVWVRTRVDDQAGPSQRLTSHLTYRQ